MAEHEEGLVLSKLDLPRVRRRVREFSTALETPELLRDFNALVARRRKRKKTS